MSIPNAPVLLSSIYYGAANGATEPLVLSFILFSKSRVLLAPYQGRLFNICCDRYNSKLVIKQLFSRISRTISITCLQFKNLYCVYEEILLVASALIIAYCLALHVQGITKAVASVQRTCKNWHISRCYELCALDFIAESQSFMQTEMAQQVIQLMGTYKAVRASNNAEEHQK